MNPSKHSHRNKYLIKSSIFCTDLLYIICFASPCHTADSLPIWLSHEVRHMISLQKVFVFFRLNETKPWPYEFWKTRFTVTQITDSIKTNVNRLKCVENSITPRVSCYGTKTRVKFIRSCLKQPKISNTHGTIVNSYTFYELGASGSNNIDPTLKTVDSVQLHWPKTLILINMDIQIMELDLTEDQVFHFLVVDLVKMC